MNLKNQTQERKIKFRAWDGKKVLYWIGVSENGHAAVIDALENASGKLSYKHYEYPDWVLMQFTGLHDKNGKEIYEGDIVRFIDLNKENKTEVCLEVKWILSSDNGGVPVLFPFHNVACGEYKEEKRMVLTTFATPPCQCEVIGNIFETPELLNTK